MLRSGPAAMMMSFFSNPKKDLEQVHFFLADFYSYIYIYRYMYIHVIYVYIYIYTRIHMYIYIYICQKHRFARCFSLPIDF